MKDSPRLGLSSSERASVTSIIVASRVADELCSCAAASANEVCGGLYGTVEDARLLVRGIRHCMNQAAAGYEFALDLDELFAARPPFQQRLVGIFHSHPESKPVPSEFDRSYLARAGLVWGIIGKAPSMKRMEARFFIYSQGIKELRTDISPCSEEVFL
jgi:proteasome lid subunit RPN8/RPN11